MKRVGIAFLVMAYFVLLQSVEKVMGGDNQLVVAQVSVADGRYRSVGRIEADAFYIDVSSGKATLKSGPEGSRITDENVIASADGAIIVKVYIKYRGRLEIPFAPIE